MLRNARTAMKFFVYGIIVGLLFAPQSGAELRKQIFDVFNEALGGSLSGVTGGDGTS